MFIRNGKRFDPFRPHEIDGVRYPHLRDVQLREQLGITEIPDPTPPEDFSDDIYYVTTQDEAPYVIWTRKSDEQINQAKNAKIQQQIDSEERNAMVPRVVREFMLSAFAAQAAAAGVDPMLNVGYARLKTLDDGIANLRRSKK